MTAEQRDPYLDPDSIEAPSPVGRPARGRRLPRRFQFALAAALVVGVWLGVTIAGQAGSSAPSTGPLPAGHPTIGASPTTPTPTAVDKTEIAALSARAAATPPDVDAMKTLVARYVGAFDWAQAASWQAKVVAAQPTDVDARLVLGVYQFNAADMTAAEASWLEVTRQRPDSVEAFYNLGFLYLARSPADNAKARAAWDRVVTLAPNSEMGQWVSSQLSVLPSASPTPQATPS